MVAANEEIHNRDSGLVIEAIPVLRAEQKVTVRPRLTTARNTLHASARSSSRRT
jgi:hypothetical protein